MNSMNKAQPTPYSELNSVLKDLVNNARKILSNNFVGAYLHGSFAIGDFDFNSDVDFIIVVEEELSDKQVEELQVMHTRIYDLDNRWAKRLEYSYFPKKVLRELSSPFPNEVHRQQLWYFDNGSRSIERSDHCNTIVVRWTVREKGIILAGPSPETLIDPIQADILRTEIISTLAGWGKVIIDNPEPYSNRFYQSYLVLNYCRMLHDLYEGSVGSKFAGIKWAKVNLDPGWVDLIDLCWNERLDPSLSVRQPADPKIYTQTLKFVQYVIDESKQYESSK